MFLWKLGQDILPTRVNLAKKKIDVDSTYLVCGREEETTLHIIWNCFAASHMWFKKGSPVQKWRCGENKFMDL